jgi:hypothetical protein
MPFRPRELVMRAREAATLLLRTLDQDEMVQRFLDMYAAEYRRPGRADHPAHYHDQVGTIRREAILAMVLRVEGALPARLKVHVPAPSRVKKVGRKRKVKARSKQTRRRPSGWDFAVPVLDLFREEFFVALGQALGWTEHDANEFWRDLELYEKLHARGLGRMMRSVRPAASGPFVDRVAFILDASLIDQARRSASKFQAELEDAADRVLRNVLSRQRLD